MNIKLRNIPKFQTGNSLWYSGLVDYDPNKYKYNYDTSTLVDGDMSDKTFNPWISNIAGYDKGRYTPTTGHGAFGVGKEHYNYTKGVEGQKYYQKFGLDLLDENGNFTEMGKLWAKAVDALIPNSNHLARFYDNNGNLRTSWSTGHNDAHSRAPLTYNNLRDYVNAIRNDLILGARHNVFLNKGKRYFYKDLNGVEHWVDPEQIGNYNVSKDPVRSNWNNDHTIYWDDYELTGPGSQTPKNPGGSIVGIHKEQNPSKFWEKLKGGLNNALPDILATGRLALALNTNRKMYEEQLKGIKPQLLGSYHTYHQVTGDEGTKQGYYRRAALGQTQAQQPFTSDADRQTAYQMEYKRVGDELRAQGDLVDNAEIRRTSEISKQHDDANIARDNQVSNANYLALIQANADRQALKSNLLAANFSSKNNYLLGKETELRQKRARAQSIADQIYALDSLNRLLNDKLNLDLYDKMNNAYNAAIKRYTDSSGNIDYISVRNDPEFKKALRNYQNKQYQILRQLYVDMLNRHNGISYVKNGTKIQFKQKDDLLYKTARDTVEHFRKMVKLTDDSMKKSFKKPLKLIQPPKSTTKKMLTGGVAPFVIYTPATSGGETTINTQASDSAGVERKSTKKDKNETLDLIKDLFKELQGLPSDVNILYKSIGSILARSQAFGTEIDSDTLSNIYLQAMQQVNNIKFSKAAYDKAKEHAIQNDALDEFAVTDDGKFIVLNLQGKIYSKNWTDIKEDENPLTNDMLLNIRSYDQSGKFTLERGDQMLLTTVNKGIGLSKIGEFIKSKMLPNLGNNEHTIEGYTKKQSDKIQKGFELLIQDAPDGDYHWSRKTLDLKELIQAALLYISLSLPKNMKAVLKAHADIQGVSISNMITSLLNASSSTIDDLKITAVTGKAAKDANGNSKDKNDDISPAVALAMGLGERTPFAIQDKTNDALVVHGVTMPLLDALNHPMANATLLQVGNGVYKGQLDFRSITMGGAKIATNGINEVLIDNGSITSAELPIDEAAARNGIIKPNLNFLKNIEKADELIRNIGITDRSNLTSLQIDIINKIYRDNNLPIIYTKDGSGKPILTSLYRRFALLHATVPEKSFEDDPNFNDGVVELEENDIDRYESTMKTVTNNLKFSFDKKGWFGLSGQGLYKGILYIPMNNSMISALGSTGYKASPQDYNVIDALDLQSEFIRNSGILIQNQGDWIK